MDMLKEISWNTYIIMVSGLTAGYYLLLLTFFHKKELRFPLRPKSTSGIIDTPTPATEPSRKDSVNQELLLEIDRAIQISTGMKYPKEELIMAVRIILKKFFPNPESQDPSLLNQYIQEKCKKVCSMDFTETELKMMWVG